jgi:hypothetical protein
MLSAFDYRLANAEADKYAGKQFSHFSPIFESKIGLMRVQPLISKQNNIYRPTFTVKQTAIFVGTMDMELLHGVQMVQKNLVRVYSKVCILQFCHTLSVI